jgi:hypothetical protein
MIHLSPEASRPGKTTCALAVSGLALTGILALTWGLLPARSQVALAAKITYNRDIRPILAENCFTCHGPDRNNRKAKLRLDDRDVALKRKAIVPGQPAQSKLIARIFNSDPNEVMPPPKSHKALKPEQKELLKNWIAQGAVYEAHWAYVPPVRAALPAVKDKAWVRNPIDAFILEKLEARGIKPSPEADRRTLIRRLYLDLIGLPPAPEEVKAFLNDGDPRAYEKVVDRLLASRHFGERMAVPWLDLVRYADTVGYHGDQPMRIFPYRDYVINAFNQNKPFDQFTIEQIAGDLLPNPTTEQLIATGFNRLNMVTREGGAQPKEYLVRYSADRVRTVAIAWLGSTFGCAECHDHKFDPITMKDFYQLSAFFADIKQWGVYQDYGYTPNPDLRGWSNDHPFPPEILVESPALMRRLKELRRKMDELYLSAADPTQPKVADEFAAWCRISRAFLKKAPDGWQPLQPEAKGTVESDGRVVYAMPVPGTTKYQVEVPAGWIAALRVELLPHPSHGGKILPAGQNANLRLAAALLRKDGKPLPLQFRQAEADLKNPIYRAGEEVPGIGRGWRPSTKNLDKIHRAYWLLDRPARVAEGDRLTVTLTGAAAGCVRVSFSPFASENPLKDEVAAPLRAALGKEPSKLSREERALIQGAYLLGTAWEPAAYQRYLELYRRWLECHDGKTWTLVTQSMPNPLAVRVLFRGNWQDETGPIVQPAVAHFLPQPRTANGKRLTRLDLAKWLVSPDNPLTARAAMNRLWKEFFGAGISARLDDLGAQGEWPTHPELLDWLAVEFRESGWNIKHMVKLLVMSSAYRQSSKLRPELREVDPGNKLLASQNPRRLEAEFVRDNALAIAGLINLEYGGPAAWPYQPAKYYVNLQFPDRDYIADKDERQYRRGVYMHWQRTFLHPMLANFDAPTREDCAANRTVANTPQQALTLLNDPSYVEAARVFAARVFSAAKTEGERMDLIYERALARPAQAREKEILLRFLAELRQHYQANPTEARKLLAVGIAPAPQDISPAELAAWTGVCRTVLNLHETITRY